MKKVFQVHASGVLKISQGIATHRRCKALHQRVHTKKRDMMHLLLTKCSNFALLNNGTICKQKNTRHLHNMYILAFFLGYDAFVGGSEEW